MPVIEARRASILVPHDYTRISHDWGFAVGLARNAQFGMPELTVAEAAAAAQIGGSGASTT